MAGVRVTPMKRRTVTSRRLHKIVFALLIILCQPLYAEPLTSVRLIPYRDPWHLAHPRLQDIANRDYYAWLDPVLHRSNKKFQYTSQQVVLSYEKMPAGSQFVGHITARGLKSYFCYQMKLLGKPVYGKRGWESYGDDAANARLGYAGRWWDDDSNPPTTNITDSYYRNNYLNKPASEKRTIYGYLYLGAFITDRSGNYSGAIAGDQSYHVTWQSWQEPVAQGADLTLFRDAGTWHIPSVAGYGYGSSQIPVTLYYEYELGRPQPVTLPTGTYNCRFLLTEESFHNPVTTTPEGGFWQSVLASEDFSYDATGHPIPDKNPSNDVVFTIRPTASPASTAAANDAQVNLSRTAITPPRTNPSSMNRPPTGVIVWPDDNTVYSAGETLYFEGRGTDPEDGALPVEAFSWRVNFHYNDHAHSFVAPTTGESYESGNSYGFFTVPTVGETSADVFYRIHLTVRDSSGLTYTTYRDLVPRKSYFMLTTEPPGLQVTLDAQPRKAPYSALGVVGMTRTLGVAPIQKGNGLTHVFERWKDTPSPTHHISIPPANTTYTAVFSSCPTVSWRNAVNAAATENNLEKTGGGKIWNGGAASTTSIPSGNGFAAITAAAGNTSYAFGLNQEDRDQTMADIDFAFVVQPKITQVFENGVWKADIGPSNAGDLLKVAIEDGAVRYSRNGIILYTSKAPARYPLMLDTSLLEEGSRIRDAALCSKDSHTNAPADTSR
jgi:hypothetical protein